MYPVPNQERSWLYLPWFYRLIILAGVLFNVELILHIGGLRPAPTAESQKVRPIIVLTGYQHCGSSIIGSLLGKDVRNLYFYEPIDALYLSVFEVQQWHNNITFRIHNNGSLRYLEPIEKFMIEYFFDAVSKCQISDLPPEMCGLIGNIHDELYLQGIYEPACDIERTTNVREALQNSTQSNASRRVINSFRRAPHCHPIALSHMKRFNSVCKKAEYLVLKILRYEMAHFVEVLKDMKTDLHHVHIVRDPRGIASSFIRLKEVPETPEDVERFAIGLCNLIRHDLSVMTTSPLRTKIVLYEDFAADPQGFAADLYRWLALEMPSSVKSWLQRTTRGNKDDGKFTRKNSNETAHSWQRNLSDELQGVINKHCWDIYERIHGSHKVTRTMRQM